MKILVWGTGQDCINLLNKCPELLKYILAFVDSNEEKQGTFLRGKKIVSPKGIYEYEYDLIVIGTRRYASEICMQLRLEMNIEKDKVIDLEIFNDKICAEALVMPRIFYLKVNKEERYVFRNLQHWIDIIEQIPRSQYFILCDKDKLREAILANVNFYNKSVRFIKSSHAKELEFIVTNTCIDSWRNAGYAHLTTFYHAWENGYLSFWNIDADDTCICLSAERACGLLGIVQEYAVENNISIFSLDMWRTVAKEVAGIDHWTFGITYTDNRINWMKMVENHARDPQVKNNENSTGNIDVYFSYLKQVTEEKMETWCIENLKFIHYSDDFFEKPQSSGFFHWKGEELVFPILYYCFGTKSRGILKIADDVIKLDIGIKDWESMLFLTDYASDKIDISADL